MILGGNDNSEVRNSNSAALLVLILNPVLISVGTITMRSLRKTNEWVVSASANLF